MFTGIKLEIACRLFYLPDMVMYIYMDIQLDELNSKNVFYIYIYIYMYI